MDPFLLDLLRLLGVAVLVLANAFFVTAEFALVSVRRTRVDELIRQGNAPASFVKQALANPDRFIAATQLGITIASLGLGWLGEPALGHLIEPLIDFLPEQWLGLASHSISAAVAFAVITFLHVVIGELAPKSVALQNSERAALAVAQPTLWFERIFMPVIWLLNGAGNLLLKWMGIQPASGHQLVHSVEELKMLVRASEEGGVLEDEERDMLHAVFDFGDVVVRQVMIPRTEMIAIEADAPLDELIQLAVKHPLSKFPIYEGDLDHILGIVHTKDLVKVQHAERRTTTVRGLMREAVFVPETTRGDDLLRQLRADRQHIAIVLDEYGGTAGLVTLDDLIAEIIGEVRDPFDKSAPEIQRLPDGSALVDGMALIETVNEHFGLDLADPNYDTIAGFMLGKLDRIAIVGDEVTADGVRLRVEALDGLRIARLSLFKASDSRPVAGTPS
ncbi:MAG: HlyC/CorC family transporter [Chloroflexi bacterium]|nr:HlyC/CorC family transporter [Chloroflexota bacterium]